jgi:hypothetical protein
MTADQLKEIFSKAEIIISGRDQFYQFFKLTPTQRSAGVVDPKNVEFLEEQLSGWDFQEYAEGQIPVFVQRPIIDGK